MHTCSVEEVDSIVPCSFHDLLDNVSLLSSTVREPSAERENGDLQSARTKVAEPVDAVSSCPQQLLRDLSYSMSLGSNLLSTAIFAVFVLNWSLLLCEIGMVFQSRGCSGMKEDTFCVINRPSSPGQLRPISVPRALASSR